ncbi:MAG: class I SAM-dependent methyltransferase [Spirochaetales bacterium]|nr:class I SAM-dependent methyltransferase [Spirochaetales bacterium]
MKTFSKVPAENHYRQICCNLCGSQKSELLWDFKAWAFVKCGNCGLVYQNPQPSAKELAGRYDSEYFNYEIENEDAFFHLMELGLKDVGLDAIERRIFVEGKADGEKPVFLDVGCATGRLIEHVGNRGWIGRGVEVCREAAEYGIRTRGVDISIGTLEEAAFEDCSVDVMHSSHLVEHLTSPNDFFKEASRIIKPGGFLITVTPDISGFQARMFGSGWRSAIADHMYLFSKKTLTKMLKKNGFIINKTISWGGLAAGSAPVYIKNMADKLAKALGAGDVVCILSMISD